jgi:hypothetical protein
MYNQPSGSGYSDSSNANNTKKGAFLDQINFIHYLDENLAIQVILLQKILTLLNKTSEICYELSDRQEFCCQ